MLHKKNITIVIPTYTNFEAFSKLLKKLGSSSYPVIIIDNLPGNEKKALCTSNNINYMPQKKNIGFSPAINLGIKNANTDWILILNDDVILNNLKIVDKLLESALKNNWSAVSPILKDRKGNIENIGYKVLPIGKAELNFDQSKCDHNYLDGLTAACLLIKKGDFEAVGGFDESFFAYLEDVDLFLRMKKRKYRFGVDLESEVTHGGHETSSKMGNFKQQQDLKNWILVILKNWGLKKMVINLPGILLERGRNLSGYIKTLKFFSK